MRSLHCCAGFFLVAVSGGYSLTVVYGFLTAVASLVVEYGSRCVGSVVEALECRLSSCGTRV